MILVDVHAHLEFPQFKDDLDEVLGRARNAGVAVIIAQGVHHESNQEVLALAKKHSLVKVAMGLYPLNAPNVRVHDGQSDDFDRQKYTVEETLKYIKSHAEEITAIGEVGLDLKYSDDVEHQVENFTKILRLANQLDKPVIIHSRKAEKKVLDILSQGRVNKAVLHCFSGSRKLIQRAIDDGHYLTVTSNANRLQHFQMLAKMVPLNQLLTETDAPYLSPVAGERNEPRNVRVAVEAIAKAKGLNADEVSRVLYMNYQRLFG